MEVARQIVSTCGQFEKPPETTVITSYADGHNLWHGVHVLTCSAGYGVRIFSPQMEMNGDAIVA
jgi:hypothetical protein